MATRYSSVHQSPKGPGDGRPTAKQIIRDENLEGRLEGKVVFITGCSSGIGVETARALFLTGATLYLTARNLEKAESVLGDLVHSGRVHLLALDLESLDSVRSCAAEFLSKSNILDILICNAGIMAPPEGRTKDGFETQIGTNHLGHFLLFNLLQPALSAAAIPNRSSRVVILSSVAHRWGEFDPDNVNLEGSYEPMVAYGASKTANLWTANEIERRYGALGIHAWSVHPGLVLTDLGRHMAREQQEASMADPYLALIAKNAEQGAATSVWAAVAATLEGDGGKYLEDCGIAEPWDPTTPQSRPGYGSHAYDSEKAFKTWNKSMQLVGM
ncbi:WW domain-containing oxidoreductase [Fusarium albosuccineum]|uniref:WW domain-containing oxidoreductase n=1 Tax=Fusarium albosuccineum TaxID=1237068 RepID=A0A8H4LKJ8_9HYPO|nr:WW domain-containing oxidoreductase [Fusarium albosuccineum]